MRRFSARMAGGLLLVLAACSKVGVDHAAAQTPNGGNLVFGQAINLHNCGERFFIASARGYSVMQRLRGDPVIDRDAITGVFDRVGQLELVDTTRKQNILVYVEQADLSQQQFNTFVRQTCH